MLASKSLILIFKFMSINYLELMFVYGGVNIHIFHVDSNWPDAIYWKKSPFLIFVQRHFGINQVMKYESMYRLSVSLSYLPILALLPYSLNYCRSIRNGATSRYIFILQNNLRYVTPLHLHINFIISLYISTKIKCTIIFIEIVLKW